MAFDRREFLKRATAGATLALTYRIGGSVVVLTPWQARARGVPLRVLTDVEATRIERLADALLPGAADAGVLHFIDHQLGESPDECLLIAKYFQVPPPYADFYREGIAAAARMAQRDEGRALEDLDGDALHRLAGEMGRPGSGRTRELFYLCLRSDAVDSVYGSPQGFEKLGIPYMAHIMPPESWNA